MMHDLLGRADHGCVLLQAAYAHRLDDRPGVTVVDRCNAFGIQARLMVDCDGSTALVVPGTGYSEKGEPQEKWSDWAYNLRSVIAIPRLGKSGRFYWGWGWLQACDYLDDWLGIRRIDYIYGHSQGAALAQILAWSRADLTGLAFAVASPRVCFSPSAPICPNLHVLRAQDDLVCRLPWFAGHVGVVQELPANGRRHRVQSYRVRLAEAKRNLQPRAAE